MDELRQTTERLAIQRLIAVYAQLIDSGRLDDWGQLFTEEARFSVYGRTHESRATIVAEIGGMLLPPRPPGQTHLPRADHRSHRRRPRSCLDRLLGRRDERVGPDRGRDHWALPRRAGEGRRALALRVANDRDGGRGSCWGGCGGSRACDSSGPDHLVHDTDLSKDRSSISRFRSAGKLCRRARSSRRTQ